jgi:hypothetical protein
LPKEFSKNNFSRIGVEGSPETALSLVVKGFGETLPERVSPLRFGIWDFVGIWVLGFGISFGVDFRFLAPG